ncbi:7d37a0d9-71ab-4874-8f8d-62e4c57d0db8 [Thermothielavioides terrestris]|uniref:7d37a0d9-71ab-4874-8f8d-62e4c57d0db8 n=1 Tax=Thermothielavioides terrestris TaxID=2587410 RepID=A0A446BM45_9PEZI|nr:7d37a0d9-71ab-4874-8f8d-62e4c57d0db8 [Thermothielavioides terrestris]
MAILDHLIGSTLAS